MHFIRIIYNKGSNKTLERLAKTRKQLNYISSTNNSSVTIGWQDWQNITSPYPKGHQSKRLRDQENL